MDFLLPGEISSKATGDCGVLNQAGCGQDSRVRSRYYKVPSGIHEGDGRTAAGCDSNPEQNLDPGGGGGGGGGGLHKTQ